MTYCHLHIAVKNDNTSMLGYRYVNDSRARFNNIDCAMQFQNILNKQHNKIQYTIDKEDGNKVLQFLDIKVINTE